MVRNLNRQDALIGDEIFEMMHNAGIDGLYRKSEVKDMWLTNWGKGGRL